VPEGLLAGVRVLDLAGEPAAMTGRILADLGAEVVLAEPAEGDALRRVPPLGPDGRSLRFAAWGAGKRSVVVDGPDDPTLAALLAGADVVIDTPGFPGALTLEPSRAPHAVWVSVTPFGRTGPRAGWHASDLGVVAASGNMFSTGDPDRAPVRASEPTAYAHGASEAAVAALSGLASGRPQLVDVSLQEVVSIASMGAPGRVARDGGIGQRMGSTTGRTREIWETSDGYVSFGLRGGKARVPSLQLITKLVADDGIAAPVMTEMDWEQYSPTTATDETLRAIEDAVARYFRRHTMTELYDIACDTNLMLAPTRSSREIAESVQMASRDVFTPVGDIPVFPSSFGIVRSADGQAARPRATEPAPEVGAGPVPRWSARTTTSARSDRSPAWAGTNILEFGSGAAGPIATRYFAEHGATVLRVESRSRPDFLRVYALGPHNPHGLEGSDMFDALNPSKLSVTLNLKHPEAIAIAKRLFRWADVVAENFAPRAMRGFGLDYDTMAQEIPDLAMVSACLNGNTGPHKDYPGFGGQGSALSGYNWLTGWPDRAPLGPFGTITDSLAPRFVAVGIAAAALYRRRTGHGCYVDVSQVEAAAYTLTPWILDWVVNAHVGSRTGNRDDRAVPHGAFPTGDEDDGRRDRWVAIACWTDAEWAALAGEIGGEAGDGDLATRAGRLARVDDVERIVGAWTSPQRAVAVAERLQALGIEAVPVQDFGDCARDPQYAAREHFVDLVHPFMGPGRYERNGFRFSSATSGYARPGPTLGQDNATVLGAFLGCSEEEQAHLHEVGAVE
jgi:crotonobetainyl-CoA:carnitine CoA-transferase CaiB-like acyl-CoA transferase